ncbi:hypothetical protein GGH94_000496 [Coemansia aciculifera]|uniref:RRM domain-containing protein n=1 Tax=Coemansia aciculifera TaxID=417176 RepID=A0A9W8IMK3_9FUNG|nr:hypothetical protein GGH94_000496 [Coemansia aciculifera]KAJ2875287.1 hypothetical protein GGH93_001709 [Coemansia aciculifera]
MAATSHLFVGRLPREMSSDELEKIFATYGKLSRCDVKRGASLGYGFVEFDEICDAEAALKECNGMDIRGERMVVEFAKGPARKRDDNSCFRCGQEGIALTLAVVDVAVVHAGMYRFGGRNRQRSRDRGDRGDRRDQRNGGRPDSDRRRPYSRSRSPPRGGRDSRPHHDSHRSNGGYSRRNHSRSASRSPAPRGNHRGNGDGGRRPPLGARSRSPPPRGQRGDRYSGPNKDFERRSADSAVGEDVYRR